MSGPGPDTSPLLSLAEQAAGLRHDLVNPIGLIIGYCELLIAEATDQGFGPVVAPLSLIRRMAFGLLAKIDGVLLGDPAGRTSETLRQLGEDLLGPTLLLVQEADELLRAVAAAEPNGSLAEDLDKVRSAGAQLVVLIESLESALVADA